MRRSDVVFGPVVDNIGTCETQGTHFGFPLNQPQKADEHEQKRIPIFGLYDSHVGRG